MTSVIIIIVIAITFTLYTMNTGASIDVNVTVHHKYENVHSGKDLKVLDTNGEEITDGEVADMPSMDDIVTAINDAILGGDGSE